MSPYFLENLHYFDSGSHLGNGTPSTKVDFSCHIGILWHNFLFFLLMSMNAFDTSIDLRNGGDDGCGTSEMLHLGSVDQI
jgi:hypothetical protein